MWKENKVDYGVITLNKQSIAPGESRLISLTVARLPSGTQISIKAHVYRSEKPGPTVLVMGGVHGDEINGIEIVRRAVFDKILAKPLRGTIIAIPVLNVYGFINFSRDVPDGKDVNRSFPGLSSGSLASRVAATLTKNVLPLIDVGMDFHTGGSTLYNYPQVRYSTKDPDAFEIAKVFAPPFIIQKPLISKSLRKTSFEMGKTILVYEGGEALRLDGLAIQKGLEGMQRVLNRLEMIDKAPEVNHDSIHVIRASWSRASQSGLFMWTQSSGCEVRKQEPLGFFRDKDGLEEVILRANRSGYIIGHNNTPVVHQGDALFHIGHELEKINRDGS